MSIFREYDIRGIVGKTLTNEIAMKIAYAFGKMLKKKSDVITVALGRDDRLSSDGLNNSIIRGLTSSGVDVVDIGLVPTPLLYYSTFKFHPTGAMMITGSHNPPEYNGIKLCVGNDTLYGGQIKEIGAKVKSLSMSSASSIGSYSKRDIVSDYTDMVMKDLSHLSGMIKKLKTPVKIVIDSGNGMAGTVAPKLFRQLGFELCDLFSKPDGHFPNHHPDPTVETNLYSLKSKVKELEADFGVAYDGDADRIGAIDEMGNIIWGDKLLLIFALDIIKKWNDEQAPIFISEVKSSSVLYDTVKAAGGNIIMWKTGHSLIKAKMKETGAVLAGEMSGHIFFHDRYLGYDDAIYASLRLAEVFVRKRLEDENFKLSDLIKSFPHTVSTPEIRSVCPDDIKHKIPGLVENAIKKGNYKDIKNIITIDGIRVVFDHGWALVRASNTEPVLVSRFEADNQENLKRIKSITDNIVAKCTKQAA